MSPRLEVEALVNGSLARGNLHVSLHDLGFGGFAIEAPIAFTMASRHEFRFVTAAGMVVRVAADAVYTRPLGPRDGMQQHLTGFKFAMGAPDADQSVSLLMDAATSPLTFEE
jgi:hypothetical protein